MPNASCPHFFLLIPNTNGVALKIPFPPSPHSDSNLFGGFFTQMWNLISLFFFSVLFNLNVKWLELQGWHVSLYYLHEWETCCLFFSKVIFCVGANDSLVGIFSRLNYSKYFLMRYLEFFVHTFLLVITLHSKL